MSCCFVRYCIIVFLKHDSWLLYLPVLRTVWGGNTGMIGVKIKENKEISCANHEDILSVLDALHKDTFNDQKVLDHKYQVRTLLRVNFIKNVC